MAPDLFAGIPVRDYDAARSWYERLLGSEPAFYPHDTEAVWELAEHRYVYILEDRDAAGGAIITIFVDDLDTVVAEIALRGIEPSELERPIRTARARRSIATWTATRSGSAELPSSRKDGQLVLSRYGAPVVRHW